MKKHQWEVAARGFGRRFAFGSVTALSLTLVAFEWTTTTGIEKIPIVCDFTEPLFDPVPLFTIKRDIPETKSVKNPISKNANGPIAIAEDVPEITTDIVEPSVPEPPSADASAGTLVDPIAPAITMPVLMLGVEVRPHFEKCINEDRDRMNECTEDRIHRHLQRNIEIPSNVIDVSTTVTFEIDAQGKIGRLHCAPKVSREVEREIARVIRSLPEFIPGSQAGHPVAVYYQIPLRLRKS
ncbi:MAG: hypothetical protein M3R08_00425 [Bacteroidota bacterium]|nr:hypothetical protein [Bacteroidota bacterium]